jgi:hypothetical protein
VELTLRADVERVETSLRSEINRVEISTKAGFEQLEARMDAKFAQVVAKFARVEEKIPITQVQTLAIMIPAVGLIVAVAKLFH